MLDRNGLGQWPDSILRYNRFSTVAICYLAGFIPVLEGSGKVWKLLMPFSRTLKVLENESFFKWLWKRSGFLFGKILKYPKMNKT